MTERRFDHGRTGRQAFVRDAHLGQVTVFPNGLVDDEDLEALCADLNEVPTRASEFRWQAQALMFNADPEGVYEAHA